MGSEEIRHTLKVWGAGRGILPYGGVNYTGEKGVVLLDELGCLLKIPCNQGDLAMFASGFPSSFDAAGASEELGL